MSAPYRTLTHVHNLLMRELRRIAEMEGPEAEEILPYVEITIDEDYGVFCLVARLEVLKTVCKEWRIPVSSFTEMSKDELENTVPIVMRSNLSLLGQVHFVRLHKYFPKAIKDVVVEMNPERCEKVVKVYFKNGHIAEAPEAEAKTELFIAKCSMLFDLPQL